MKRILGLDYETRSSVPIKECGSYKYIESPDFRALLLAYAFDDDPVTVVDFTAGQTIPPELRRALTDPEIVKTAYNCAFEREVTRKVFGPYCDPEQWEDTMILAAQCGLPLSLAGVSEALGLGEDKGKMKIGKDLIKQFCVPRKDGSWTEPEDAPEDWCQFKIYNGRDVETERTVRKLLEKFRPSEIEHRFWSLDQRINDRGMKIDRTLASAAMEMDGRFKDELTAQAVAMTGLNNPKSVSQVKEWLLEQEGIEVPSLNKKVVAGVVAQLSSERAKEFMILRSELARSSTSKYSAMLRSACEDDHIRGCFQFYGANRTGRFAGRLVQLQNLGQNHMSDLSQARKIVRAGDYETVKVLYTDVTSTLAELVRTALIPEDGHRFIVSDFSAIEARVIAWIANEKWRMKVFADGGDIYCASASQMFKVPVEKHGQNGHLRQKGKIAELALGYGGGVNALKAFGADRMGMTAEEMAETVALWRESSPHICDLWRSMEQTAIRTVVRGTPSASRIGNVRFDYEDGILWMTLPSGRRIAYFGAKYEESRFKHGQRVLSYMGTDQKTKKWARVETWGGKLVENLVQATARDCLRETMLALSDAGYDIRAHVHDEVIITEPVGGRSVEEVCAMMARPIPWAPGLLLRGDGYETPFYMKD